MIYPLAFQQVFNIGLFVTILTHTVRRATDIPTFGIDRDVSEIIV